MTTPSMYAHLKEKLGHVIPDTVLRQKAVLAERINELKKEKNAVILVHNYVEAPLFYSVADLVGDSLDLSRRAAEVEQDIILFCGVTFMAETAKLLSPEKTVLCPVSHAGCSLAESITAKDIINLKQQYPGAPVVTYVNTYADAKAETDICCTSGNAVQVIQSLDSDQIIFLPDEFLATNIARQTGKTIITASGTHTPGSTADIVGWAGHCEVHERFTPEDVDYARKQYPDLIIMTHPEAPPAVVDRVDYSGGTSGMIRYIRESSARQFMLLTECAMSDNVAGMFPDKEILSLSRLRCPHMNLITMEDTLAALKHNQYVIDIPEELAARARGSVQRMIEIG